MPENNLGEVKTKKPWQSQQLIGVAIVLIPLILKIAGLKGWLGEDMLEIIKLWLSDVLDLTSLAGGAYTGYARLFKNSGKEISLK